MYIALGYKYTHWTQPPVWDESSEQREALGAASEPSSLDRKLDVQRTLNRDAQEAQLSPLLGAH